jgi:para-nitrobenzyl esterase
MILAPFGVRAAAIRVMTDSGVVEGLLDGGQTVFLGIPFAAPPTGELRWQSPRPIAKWSGVRSASSFGPACPQSGPDYYGEVFREIAPAHPYYTNFRVDEDCLYLNVWTKNLARARLLPVMVWIHGGSNIGGTGAHPPFGPTLSEKSVVFVSFNYRLGALGFMAHPALSAESIHRVSGNYGIEDQIAALQWIQRNISQFGGDPRKVTVFGESAGGTMICYLMASPLARGLFQRAILESCTCQDYISPQLKRAARYFSGTGSSEDAGLRLQRDLGVPTGPNALHELRNKTADEIVKASESDPEFLNFLYAGGTVDGWVLREQPALIYSRGGQMKIPILLGSNADEGTVMLGALGDGTVASYKAFLKAQFDAHAEEVLRAYPADTDSEARSAFLALTEDYQRGEAVRTLARDAVRIGERAYLYYFTYPSKGAYASQGLGSFHGLELSFVGGGYFRQSRWGDPDSEDLRLADVMSGYWTCFASTGDPNGPGLPAWPPYTSADLALQLGKEIKLVPVPHADRFSVFERILGASLAEAKTR